MADGMLLQRLHLAEGQGVSIRQEHWIITEALVPAGWPDELAVHFAFKYMGFAARPGKSKCGGEVCRAVATADSQFALYLCHGHAEILARPRPTRGIDTGCTVQRMHFQA